MSSLFAVVDVVVDFVAFAGVPEVMAFVLSNIPRLRSHQLSRVLIDLDKPQSVQVVLAGSIADSVGDVLVGKVDFEQLAFLAVVSVGLGILWAAESEEDT